MIPLPEIPPTLEGIVSQQYQDALWWRKIHLLRLFGTDDPDKIAAIEASRPVPQIRKSRFVSDEEIILVSFRHRKLKEAAGAINMSMSTLYQRRKRLGIGG